MKSARVTQLLLLALAVSWAGAGAVASGSTVALETAAHPPHPIELDTCIFVAGKGVGLSFFNVSPVVATSVQVRFTGPGGSETAVANGTYSPNVRIETYVDPPLARIAQNPRTSVPPVACAVAGVTFADGSTWTAPAGAHAGTHGTAETSAAAPLTIGRCSYSPSDGTIVVSYTNTAQVAANMVRIRASGGERRTVYVRDVGTFSPNVAIDNHAFAIPMFNKQQGGGPLTCSAADITYVDGTTWRAPRDRDVVAVLFKPLGNGITIGSCSVDSSNQFNLSYRNTTGEDIQSAAIGVTWSNGSEIVNVNYLPARATRSYASSSIGQTISNASSSPSCRVRYIVYRDGETWP